MTLSAENSLATMPAMKVLICDDSVTNCMILQALLEDSGITQTKTLTDPTLVADEIGNNYNLLILDFEMPKMTGLEVMLQLRQNRLIDDEFPVLFLTGQRSSEIRHKALELGAADFVNKPFDQFEVILRVKNLLKVRHALCQQKELNVRLEAMVEARTQALSKATDILIKRLAKAGELRDNETGEHVVRVGKYARIVAEGAGLPPEIAFMLEKAAPLHDLGKIGIPDRILLKNGKLDANERAFMETHTQIGADLLEEHESPLVMMANAIALRHHERWDGQGYPDGLQGESIPVEARITAICDVFDALISKRPYKPAWAIEDAIAAIRDGAGTQFDPNLVEAFIANIEQIEQVVTQFAD